MSNIFNYLFVSLIFLHIQKYVASTPEESLFEALDAGEGTSTDLGVTQPLDFSELGEPEARLSTEYVQVTTFDQDGTFHMNDNSKYVVEDHENSFYVIFNHGARCIRLRYNEKLVWEHDDTRFGKEYPNYLFFEKGFARVRVNYPTLYLHYEYSEKEWKLTLRTDMKQVVSTGLTLVTADDASGRNSKENDTTKYEVKKVDYIVQYEMNEGTFCMAFKSGDNLVWKYDPNNSKLGFPKALYLHTDLGLIFVDFKDSSSIYRCNKTGCKCVAIKDMKGLTKSDIRIFTEDPSDSSKIIENDTSQYETKALGHGYIFNFREGAKCFQLKYQNRSLWEYGYKSGDEYPQAIFVNFYFRLIGIKFSKYSLIYMYLDRWRYIYKSPDEAFTEADFQIVTKDDENMYKLNVNDESKYELIKYPFNYAFIYNLTPDAKCTQVKCKNKVVWKHDANKVGESYPNTVYFNKNLKMLIVSSPKYFYVYMKLFTWINIFNSLDKKGTNIYLLLLLPFAVLLLGLLLLLVLSVVLSVYFIRKKARDSKKLLENELEA